MVRIETAGARAALDALETRSRADIDRALDALQFHIDYYGTHLDSVDRETFRELLESPGDEPSGFALDALADGFQDASERSDEIRDTVEDLAGIETAAVERTVRRYLPGDPSLDATVHAVVDGFNGGFQHAGDVGISVLERPPGGFERLLRHELHHVGVREVRADDPFGRLTTADSPAQDTADLVGMLLYEGLAIAEAQGGLSVYEDDPAAAAVIEDYRDRERDLFADFDEALRTLPDTEDPDRRQETIQSLVTDPEGVLPPSHYVGARIVQEIDRAFGEARAVELVTAIGDVLPTYRAAARETGAPTLSETAVERASSAVATVNT